MRVCRICLKHSFKNVYDLDYGSPSIRAKLLTCLHNINSRFFDLNYCICEPCFNAVNTAYELREMQLAAEADIKSAMTNEDDYANLNKYVIEASFRREKLYNNKIQIRAEGILLNDIKEEEQLAAIATIDPTTSTSDTENTQREPLALTAKQQNVDPGQISNQILQVMQQHKMSDVTGVPGVSNMAGTSTQHEPTANVPHGKMCHICFRQYPNRTCLLSHVRAVHHTQGKTKVIKRSVLNRKLHLLSPDEMCAIHMEAAKKCVQTQCLECRITLKCVHELQYHITAIHKGYQINNVNFNVKCDVCSAYISHKYLQLHLKGHELQVNVERVENNYDTEEKKHDGVVSDGSDGDIENNAALMTDNDDNTIFWHCRACKAMFRSDEHSMEEHFKIHHDIIAG